MNLNDLFESDPMNYDSDWDYQDAVARSGQSRSSYRPAGHNPDDTFDDDVAYSKKMYQLSQQQKAAKTQGVTEGDDYSAVTSAITRRIITQHPEVLAKYGPAIVGQAIDEIADFVGDVDEIGSSDVSGWVSQVIRSLGRFAPVRDESVAEGKGDLGKALGQMGGGWSGWEKDDSSDPDIEKYWYDDGEGGYDAGGTIEHNLKTGEVTVNYSGDEYHGDDVNGTFKNIGDALTALRGLKRGKSTKAPNFDRLSYRSSPGPDDLRKTDRTGRKGTIGGGFANNLKGSIQANKGRLGPKGVLPESDVDSDGYSVDHADSGEYDYEGDQAKDQLNTIVRAAQRLNGLLDDNENMPEWVQMKITNAADYIDTAADYIESNQEPELDEGEKVGNMDADKFDAALARMKKLAGAGPMKTVWDPAKRVYKNIPTAVQPRK
jgi:hypothetical protein